MCTISIKEVALFTQERSVLMYLITTITRELHELNRSETDALDTQIGLLYRRFFKNEEAKGLQIMMVSSTQCSTLMQISMVQKRKRLRISNSAFFLFA